MNKRMLRIMSLGCALMLLLSMVGCALETQAQDLMKDVKANAVESLSDMEEGNKRVTDFAVRLFQANEEAGKNILISPLSVLSALSMTVNGAQGETLTQMEEVLGMSATELNQYLYSYTKSLSQSAKAKLRLANSIWFTEDERFQVNQEFLQVNADYYDASIYKAPFDKSTLKDINRWVEHETDGMIPEVLDDISKDAVMYLVNALAFEAQWPEPYKENQIREAAFTLEDGTAKNVEFMHGSEHDYLEDESATGFLKFYKGKKYAFVALLPKEGISISDYVAGLNGEALHQMLTERQNVVVYTKIPKFEIEYDTEMSSVLKKMGMTDAFDDVKADFSGLGYSDAGNIFISRVIHKTYISVAEKGTKAGAATVVEMNDGASMMEYKEVHLDRPFVYMLIDCENYVPFFIGTMVDVD